MMSIRILSVALVTAVVLAACGGGSSGPTSPGQTLVAAMELIRDGKPEEFKAMVVADDQMGAGMFSGVYSSGWADEGGLERVEVASEEINGDSATVEAAFHFANGSTENVTYELQQQDGAWKIHLP